MRLLTHAQMCKYIREDPYVPQSLTKNHIFAQFLSARTRMCPEVKPFTMLSLSFWIEEPVCARKLNRKPQLSLMLKTRMRPKSL